MKNKACIEAWCAIVAKNNSSTKYEILEQILMGNCNIKHKQQSIFISNWTKGELFKINDIWNTYTNNWQEGQSIYNQLIYKRNWIVEYNKLMNGIPKTWTELLRGEIVEFRSALLKNTKETQFSHSEIKINGNTYAINKA